LHTTATFTKFPSGKWRAQLRRDGLYRGQTFTLKRDAQAWAKQIEVQAEHIVASGYQPVPEGYSVGDLIDGYARECNMGGRAEQASGRSGQSAKRASFSRVSDTNIH
jgi:hypothetical protein